MTTPLWQVGAVLFGIYTACEVARWFFRFMHGEA